MLADSAIPKRWARGWRFVFSAARLATDRTRPRATSKSKRQLISDLLNLRVRGINRFVEQFTEAVDVGQFNGTALDDRCRGTAPKTRARTEVSPPSRPSGWSVPVNYGWLATTVNPRSAA